MRISVLSSAVLLGIVSLLAPGTAHAQQAQYTSWYAAADAALADRSGPSCAGAACGNCGSAACAGNCESAACAGDCSSAAGCGSCYSGCGSCCDSGCGSCCDDGCGRRGLGLLGCIPQCDGCPRVGILAWTGLDTFKGQPDGTWPPNFGLVNGINTGAMLVDSLGLAGQLGMSYGIYDFQGRQQGNAEGNSAQEQIFITTGVYRRATNGRRLSAGAVYDWMINDNFGSYAQEPFLGQFRVLIGFALSARNEIGYWGAFHDRRDTQVLFNVAPNTYRSVSQSNLFWHHNFLNGSDSYLYVGIPERHRLAGGGSLGEWVFGGTLTQPITSRLGTYINFAYMCPSAPAGVAAGLDETYQLGAGLTFYPGRNSRNSTVAGRCSMPLIPVATNGTFMTETLITQ